MRKFLFLLLFLLPIGVSAKKKPKSISDSCLVSNRTIWRHYLQPPKRIFEVPEGWAIDTLVDTTYVLRKIKPTDSVRVERWQNGIGHPVINDLNLDTIGAIEW